MLSKSKEILKSSEMILLYIIITFCLVISIVNPAFIGTHTVILLLRAMLVLLIFAMCELIVIISGGIDVSFPAIACISLYATVKIMLAMNIDNALVAFIIAGSIGMFFGAINGFLISKIKMPPLIATLGMSSILNGATLAFLGTAEISNIPNGLDKLSQVFIYTYISPQGIKYSLTALIIIPIIICLAVHYILKKTMLGRGIYAIGGDKNAARIAGFNVTKIQFIVYMTSGFLAGIGGLIYMILMRQASPQVLMGGEMMIIAAVVMGGARITGGHGSVIGSILGIGLICLIENNLIMLGIPTHFQSLTIGLIIIVGVCITSIKAKRIANSAKV